MSNTKNRIQEAALELFNEKGLKNTTLQLIADKLDISVGNLAYHYKNKPEIISAHNVDLQAKLQVALSHYRNYPNFLDFQIQLTHIFQVVECYQYMFISIGEINILSPDTFQTLSSFYAKLLLQIESRISYHQERGILIGLTEESVNMLAATITDLVFFNPTTTLFVSDQPPQEKFQKIWNLFLPILTEKGTEEWNTLISPILI
ncbi:MAG: TetR/AcrR family transcriptional regulator [Bacteroidota bacterium]